MLERRLARAEQRMSELERHVTQQRHVLAWLDAAGRGDSETAVIARELLGTMEHNLRRETAERRRLRRQLPR